jgi:hypothetical protein
MKALVLNAPPNEWDTITGMNLADMPEPDESLRPADSNKCIIKPLYTGFFGSGKSLWFRHAFKDMLLDSRDHDAPVELLAMQIT